MRRLLPFIVCSAALAGCGKGEPTTTDRDGTLFITASVDGEYRYTPENIRTREGRIHIVLRNKGRLTHNLRVTQIDREIGEETADYGTTPTAQPGASVSTDVTLGPGRYKIVCTIGNHDDLGQYGELTITPKGSGS